MTDRPKARRKHPSADPAMTKHEAANLRFRLAEQDAEIEGLRHNIEWLTEELDARDAEMELTLMDLAVPGSEGEDDPQIAYRRMIQRLRRLVREHVPPGSRIVVAGEGDEALLRHAGCRAEHLSQDRSGGYTGFPPNSSLAAVVHLEAARWRGVDVFLIPQCWLWWLEHYDDFARHLERRYTLMKFEEDTGAVWDLRKRSVLRDVDDLLAGLRIGLTRQPVILDWHTGHDLATSLNECNVFSPLGDGQLPYLDATIDVVAVGDTDQERISEARRVASALVVAVTGSEPVPAVDVLWQSEPADGGLAGVSIVVASQDGRPSTAGFLSRLLDTLPSSFAGEVVVDASSDAVVPRLGPEATRLKRIRVTQSRDGDGFAARVRRGAEAASGDTLVVLDSSIWPVAGWLPPLVHTLRHLPGAGVVTGMLVEPDGRLAGVGTALDADGQPSATGAGDYDLGAVRYSYVRTLDVAPNALFAARRQTFLECNRSRPSDREAAAALCAHVRSGGMTVLYQPETLAIKSWPDAATVATTDGRPIDR